MNESMREKTDLLIEHLTLYRLSGIKLIQVEIWNRGIA